ncbi:MAG TPA: YtxH domain-containing protein [Oculatellaceae cyanobacterium]
MSESSGRFFEGLVVGGILGFLFGMLAAPKSGADLRRQLADGSEDLYKNASDSITDLKKKSTQAISEVQTKGGDVLSKARDTVQNARETVSSKLQEMAGQSTSVLVDDVESMTSG